ncbi:MAG: stage II sporulation protein P [Lachnospiraceae bacterium]
MRKSTLWLAVLFFACVVTVGWKCTPARVHIKTSVSEWVSEFSLQRLKDFLTWRSPGIALEQKAEEADQLLEAEQQAYALRMENDSWKEAKKDDSVRESGSSSENEKEKTETGMEGENTEGENAKENVEITEKINAENEDAENEDAENGEKEAVKTVQAAESGMSFPEYIQAARADNQLLYSWDQLTDFDFVTEKFYQIHGNTTIYPSQLDLENFLKKDLSIDRNTEGPQILIYHTHGSEYFKDSDKDDPDTLITGVGNVLEEILEEKYGYNVYHDTTVFPYNSSYSRGREKVQQLLEKYPGIQVVIDMHRDSAPNTHLVTEIGGKPTAQIMFFNGMSQTVDGPLTSRENDNLSDNLAFSLQMKLAAEQLYPGFTRKNYLKAYRYNMDLMGRYTLIEVGAETNTLEEEINAMEPLAEILHCVLQ